MGYKSETVAATIQRLNVNHFLPAIQREFVWGPEKIVQLFDSLLRGYPIGSFLFWQLDAVNRTKWQVYRFIEDASADGVHNQLANLDGVQQSTLVLDGQQRLTSLLIGLKGTYRIKKKYRRANSAAAWTRQSLYLDLFKDPTVLQEDGEQGLRYGLTFAEQRPGDDSTHHWLKVGKVLDFVNQDAFAKFKDEIEEALPGSVTRAQIKVVGRNLDTLHRAIWKEELIAYHTELDQDYDRVLDIFVRTNAGGVKLTKSDLLLSMMTAKWDDVNAREEIHAFVEHLNGGLHRRNDFDTDFIMKAALVLSDLPVTYKVENFSVQNLELIKSRWEKIRASTEKTVALVNSFGIDRDTLTSANAIIPLMYYVFRNPQLTLGGTTTFDVANGGAMRLWLMSALLRKSFSGQSDTALGIARTVLAAQTPGDVFPAEKINAEMGRSGRATGFDDDLLDETLSLPYGDPRTFLALSLLYDDVNWSFDPQVDHIFPQRLFKGSSKRDDDLHNRLGNLEILTAKENQEKSDTPFDEWIGSRDESFLRRQLIPLDATLWSVTSFDGFMSAREALIRQRLKSLFAKKGAPEGA